MDDAPERIWVDYTPHTETYQYVDTVDNKDGSTEYVRADLYEELKTKVEVATKALDDIVIDSTWGLEHETYMRCRVALRQLKEDKE